MKNEKCGLKIAWTATIGQKWQIVIPKEIRSLLNLDSGDSITFMIKDNKYLGIVSNENISEIINYINSEK